MGQGRQIRFFIPPFFFFLSLLWGLYWSDTCHMAFWDLLTKDRLPLLALGLGASIPIGFLINVISILVLNLLFLPTQHTWETWLKKDAFKRMLRITMIEADDEELTVPILKRYNLRRLFRRKVLELAGVVVFSHGEMYNDREGLQQWLSRQWSAFVVSFNSLIAVGGFWLFTRFYPVFDGSSEWNTLTLILCILFTINACITYLMDKRMITLLAERYETLPRCTECCDFHESPKNSQTSTETGSEGNSAIRK